MIITDPEKPHLGGFMDGPVGDEATYFPELWSYMVNDYSAESVIDVGCGSGVAVRYFRELVGPGNVCGIDGIPQHDPNIIVHDYTLGPLVPSNYDLAWCCEVVEHIQERFLPNILSTLACAKTILITHAFPGQPGHYHVNCRMRDYWIGVFAAIGYQLDKELTATTRDLACLNKSLWNHYRRSGMAFVRYSDK